MREIPIAHPDLGPREAEYALNAITNQKHISSFGKYLDRFEELLAQRFQRTHALSTSNGTTALHLALLALGIKAGDEVIIPTLTFAAPAATVVCCGASPVFIDSNPSDWTLDVSALESKRTSRTKALIAVDLYGMPCDYAPIRAWCDQHGIFLIEDAAEAHGAMYGTKPVGSFGHISCFSFYGNKILTTGEGGACLTDDPALFETMRILKNHGMSRPGSYIHDVVGYNYRMTNVQAAIGVAQLERFDELLEKRHRVDTIYRNLLADCPNVAFAKPNTKDQQSVFWLCSILVKKDVEKVLESLHLQGMSTRRFFKPLHQQLPYAVYADGDAFPIAEQIASQGINLPSSSLLTDEEITYVCTSLKAALQKI